MSIIDISKWQGVIDFGKLKNNVDLVINRVQYGSNVEDTKHKEYEQGLKDNGIPFGSYAYARFVSPTDAVQEAKDFLARVDKEAKFLVIDVEEVTASDLIGSTQAFIDYIKANDSRKIGLYTGEYFYHQHGLDQIKQDFLWIAKYSSTKPDIVFQLWQNTDSLTIDGISTKVDASVLGNVELDFFVPQPKPINIVKPSPKLNVPSVNLRIGDKGQNVKDLQNLLNHFYFKCGNADGDFGPKTKDALTRFQKVYSPKVVDGIYGNIDRANFHKLLGY